MPCDDHRMDDDRALLWNAPPPPRRQPQPGELLFEFFKDSDRYRVELRDYGELGVEAQYFVSGELWQACRFPSRAWAVRWAEQRRTQILRGEHVEWP